MIVQIKNEYLNVEIDTFGAQMCSIKDADGVEYLWQGDADSWNEQAPNLFPYIGRMTEKQYCYDGKRYNMEIHGFVKNRELMVEEQTEAMVCFRLDSDEELMEIYPFAFSFLVQFSLEGARLCIDYEVVNRDKKEMYFGIGGHPGFCIPNQEGRSFEDYYLEFPNAKNPLRVGFSEDCFVNQEETSFSLRDGKYLDLQHDLFDRDAIVLKNSGKLAVLRCRMGGKSIWVRYDNMPYFGMWHTPRTQAAFVCLEPWSSLPSRKDIVEDIAKQDNLVSLSSGRTYENHWSIEITE